MSAFTLLITTTLLYAGYNLLVKISSSHVPAGAYSTITATISLQTAALLVSLAFYAVQKQQTGASFALPTGSYFWAVLAGLCIGGAEVAYFYLFAGLGHGSPMPASVAVPVVVSGAVVISIAAGWLLLGEAVAWPQVLGALLIVLGICALFVEA
jgi:drug/metabolite transporter (DMT)-like permease